MEQDSIFMKLIVAQMALDGINASTISFFVKIFPMLRRGATTTLKMSEVAIITRGHARSQASKLEKAGYFERCTRKTWRIAEEPIKDYDLRSALRRISSEHSRPIVSQNGSGNKEAIHALAT